MLKTVVFKKAGKIGVKEVLVDDLLNGVLEVTIYSHCCKLHKRKGRPKTILHEWAIADICKGKGVELSNILQWSVISRKDILGEYYGKEYLTSKSWDELYKEINSRDIPTPYGMDEY